jgi:AMP-polyphosphate phosphotransferase
VKAHGATGATAPAAAAANAMLEAAQAGRSLSKAAFDKAEAKLRTDLVCAQFELHQTARGPVIVLLAGLAGGGRSAVLHRLTTWMDPRFIRAIAFGPRTHEERAHPPAWPYWQALPPRGRVAVFMNAWYNDVAALDHDDDRVEPLLARIREHEQMLAADRCRFVKVWLHMPERDLDRRLDDLAAAKAAPKRVLRELQRQARRYFSSTALHERVLHDTSTDAAPWTVVEATDAQYRDVAVASLVLDALRDAPSVTPAPKPAVAAVPASADGAKRLLQLEVGTRLGEDEYERRLVAAQRRVAQLTLRKRFRRRALVVVFEGVDAAGSACAA